MKFGALPQDIVHCPFLHLWSCPLPPWSIHFNWSNKFCPLWGPPLGRQRLQQLHPKCWASYPLPFSACTKYTFWIIRYCIIDCDSSPILSPLLVIKSRVEGDKLISVILSKPKLYFISTLHNQICIPPNHPTLTNLILALSQLLMKKLKPFHLRGVGRDPPNQKTISLFTVFFALQTCYFIIWLLV